MKLFKSSEVRLETVDKLFILIQSLLVAFFLFALGYVTIFEMDASIFPEKFVGVAMILMSLGMIGLTYRLVNNGNFTKKK